jgi:hypothetical protein
MYESAGWQRSSTKSMKTTIIIMKTNKARISFMIGILPALGMLLATSPVQAQIYDCINQFAQLPDLPAPVSGFTFSGWDNFEMVFAGAVDIPTQDPTDNYTDAFASSGVAQSEITVSYLNGNTVVTFSGNAITPETPLFFGGPGSNPHFGFTGPVCAPLLSEYWSGQQINSSDPSLNYAVTSPVPAVNISFVTSCGAPPPPPPPPWYSESVQVPSLPAPVSGYTFSGWDNFEMVFATNADISAQDPTDVNTDPFAAAGTNTSQITTNTLPNGNFVLTFSGNALSPSTGTNTVEFGLTGTVSAAPLFQYWTGEEINNSDSNLDYAVTLGLTGVASTNGVSDSPTEINYETIFVEYIQGGVVGGLWTEIPIVGSTPLTPTLTSGLADAANPIVFLVAGYMITATPLAVEDLNLTNDPPPGLPGSVFTPMALPPAITTEQIPPVYSPPLANPVAVLTPEGVAVTINVLAADSDPNSPPLLPLTVTAWTQPAAGGTVTLSGNDVIFTPSAGFFGTATFTYTIANSAGLTATSTVTVTVVSPPLANPVAVSTPEDMAVTINVLASDSDPNSPPLVLSVTSSTQPAVGGTVTLSGNSVIFTPTSSYVGKATFTYTIANTAGLTATSTVTVTVTPLPKPAVLLIMTGPCAAPCDQTITYTFAVTNTSQASETLTVVDPLLGGTIFSQAGVAPGQGFQFTATYVVPSGSSKVVNTATATGTEVDDASATSTATVTTIITTENVISQICGSFNPINPGNCYVWFNSHISANPGKACTIYCQNASVVLTCNNGKTYTYPMPNGQIVFTPTAASGSCAYDGANWSTTLPIAGDDEIFLSCLAIPWNPDFANCKSVCWTGTFSCDTAGINCNWQWSAACYDAAIRSCNSFGVKPCHQNPDGYLAGDAVGDHAGTPENCTSLCLGGACGEGGGNYTGSWVGTSSCSFISCRTRP